MLNLQALGWEQVGTIAYLFAAESDGLPGWAQVCIALGVALSIATKQLVPGWVYEDLKARVIQLEKDKSELITSQLTTLPAATAALSASAEANQKSLDEIRILRLEREELRKKAGGA